jgi:hypothetical protein
MLEMVEQHQIKLAKTVFVRFNVTFQHKRVQCKSISTHTVIDLCRYNSFPPTMQFDKASYETGKMLQKGQSIDKY